MTELRNTLVRTAYEQVESGLILFSKLPTSLRKNAKDVLQQQQGADTIIFLWFADIQRGFFNLRGMSPVDVQ